MTTAVAALSALTLISAAITIRARYRQRPVLVYVFKPLTTALIIGIAALAPTPDEPNYKSAILAGLVMSLAGDIFLMLPGNYFIAGLVSFLLAHIAYLIAFFLPDGPHASWLPVALVVLYGVGFLPRLWPHLGRMRGPVLVYFLAITGMAWQALERWMLDDPRADLAFPGALLFLISDSALAFDRFVRPFRARDVVVLGTYWAAQWLIALSIR